MMPPRGLRRIAWRLIHPGVWKVKSANFALTELYADSLTCRTDFSADNPIPVFHLSCYYCHLNAIGIGFCQSRVRRRDRLYRDAALFGNDEPVCQSSDDFLRYRHEISPITLHQDATR